MISITFRLRGKVKSNMEVKGRDRRKYSEEEFKRQLNLANWDNVFKADTVDMLAWQPPLISEKS